MNGVKKCVRYNKKEGWVARARGGGEEGGRIAPSRAPSLRWWFRWNDDLKMITCDRTTYDEEVVVINFIVFFFFKFFFLVETFSLYHCKLSLNLFTILIALVLVFDSILFIVYFPLLNIGTSQSCTIFEEENWDVWWDEFGCGVSIWLQ